MSQALVLRQLGLQPYVPVWQAMQTFTSERDQTTPDEIWILSHPPVFTQGQAGKAEHLLAPGDIPVVQIDRGGQVTYHGPGQLVVYLLIDIRRSGTGVRDLVSGIEQAIIETLSSLKVNAQTRTGAPGVYVGDAKIASLGLRIRRGCSYHGLSLNVAMDLEPFSRINPCGYQGLAVTQVTELVNGEELGLKTEADYMHTVEKLLLQELITRTGVYGWIDVRQTLPT
ncbi:lipoyl(octanoyl) transferase LipB [Pseudohongiella sp. SYSU M77423]|uniref:lipoyl(octanoyl) transferase LipB n=1 Tax=unclassified Pseudohongiella TaxID=2629611 RepID=UPI0023518A2F|nr:MULTISPECIES: lipoyl(octanoyl) transferase LipB [unclassified Pseudohongiella]MDH7944481.1 lipoyl(octanoyl) transferase LipB [Pseudohongiella sp. SYSU M77423]MEC8858627.1 lipoyl(octanoyl) transferase LipB [Pseudomonadota bacterium]